MNRKLFLLIAVACCLAATEVRAQTYAITNARIVTVSGPAIEKGTLVLRDGLIEAVGASLMPPADAIVIDGTGMTVYPGFIDALTNLGMQAPQQTGQQRPGGGSGTQAQQQQAASSSNSNYPAGLRPEEMAIEEIRAGEAQFEAARNAGFTTVLTVGRSGIFNGRSAVIDLAGDSVSAMTIRSPFAEHFTFTTIGGGQYPGSLLGTFSALRQMLLDAQRLQRLQKQYEANPRGIKRPDPDRSIEALFPIINRQMPLVLNASSENEINRSLDLAKEFNIRAIIAGGTEAWKVADRLKAQDVPVLLSLNFPKRTASSSPEADPESMDVLRLRAEAPKNAARLAQAGVKFAFQSGGATTLTDFFTNAAKTVDGGLSRDAAIRAMTLGSAEVLGIDDRLGSIEKGKIANVVLVRGDVFGRDRFVSRMFVDGKLFEMKEPPARREGPTRGGTISAPAVATVAGNYTINVDIPGQPLTGTLALTQQGALLTGSLTTSLGVMPIKDGKVSAEGFSFSGSVEFGGSQIEIVVKGSVSGTQISGTIDSPQGTVPFSGTRNP
jgi:imidazolonepropionase-like amidohydrolase